MKSGRMIIEDVKRGLYYNRYRFLMALLLITALILTFTVRANVIYGVRPEYGRPGLLDNIFYMLCGIEPIRPENMQLTDIPYVWISVQFLCSFVCLDYVYNDRRDFGKDILLRSRSKCQWWVSKCIVTIISVMGIYGLIWLVSMVAAAVNNQLAGPVHFKIVAPICQLHPQCEYTSDMMLYLIFIPLMLSIVMSLLQIAITQYTGPVISLFVIMAIDVTSVFVNSRWLLGNLSMLARSRMYADTGISLTHTVTVCVVVAAVGFVAGLLKFVKSDIIM